MPRNANRPPLRAKFGSMIAAAVLAMSSTPASADSFGVTEEGLDAIERCVNTNTEDPIKLKAVIKHCTTALKGGFEDGLRVHILISRAIAYRDNGQLEPALADLREARKLAPDHAEVTRMLGWTYRMMGRQADAVAEYDRLLKLGPDRVAYLSRCVVRIDAEQYEKALADCEIAHKMGASEDAIYFTAAAYLKLGRHTDAIRTLEPELNGDHASGRLYGKLSEAYAAADRSADADRAAKSGRLKFPKDKDLNQPPPND